MTDWQTGLHPALIRRIETVLALMAKAHQPMQVVQGLRTVAQQQTLYARGRTEKGPIVTNCDGVRIRSNHQAQIDGYGHAVDCAFTGPEPFSEMHNWALYGDVVKDQGLIWGGDFHTLVDRPHAELPHNFQETLRA